MRAERMARVGRFGLAGWCVLAVQLASCSSSVSVGAGGQKRIVPSHITPPSRAAPESRLDARVDSVLALMTLEEKVGQLSITGGRDDLRALIRAGKLGGTNGVLPNADVVRYTREMQEVAMQSRLRIPLLFMGDVIHGFRTTFPVPLAEAATWDPELVRRADSVAAVEATAAGVTWTFAPMLDIARDPRWGRVVESPGEDPYLGAVMAAAHVRGFQGNDLRSAHTMLATAKHFAGYGAAEAGRDYNTVDMSERRFRNVYLPTFRAGRDAGVATVMAAFTALNGVPATGNKALLTGILRDEWGFHGVVVSDYDAVPELQAHRVAATPADAAALAMNAGVDVELHSVTYMQQLPALVRSGRVSEAHVDSAVRRVLRVKFELGLFDDSFRYGDSARAAAVTLSPAHRALARDVARKSIVLLKNDGPVLPLRRDLATIAVLGPLAADSVDPLGPVHAMGRPEDVQTVLAGIREKVGSAAHVLYAPGADMTDSAALGVDVEDSTVSGVDEAVRLARRADVAIVVVGELASMSGEGGSRSRIGLPGGQRALIQAVLATGTPMVVVLMNGRPLAIPWVATHASAILETWFAGAEAGNAIADVLFGDSNPSAKLPVTFPRDEGQIPIYYAHLSTGQPRVATDRYTSRYLDVPNTPLYPFGFGLSYTSFSYSDVRLSRSRISVGDTVEASVTVTNTGSRSGEEVVQLYVRDDVASVAPPVQRLRAFRKITLAPGEARDVTFQLTPEDLALRRADMTMGVEPGRFTIFIGTSSADTREAHLAVVQ